MSSITFPQSALAQFEGIVDNILAELMNPSPHNSSFVPRIKMMINNLNLLLTHNVVLLPRSQHLAHHNSLVALMLSILRSLIVKLPPNAQTEIEPRLVQLATFIIV